MRVIHYVVSRYSLDPLKMLAHFNSWLFVPFQHGCGAIHYVMSRYSHDPLKVMEAMMESNADVNLRDYVSFRYVVCLYSVCIEIKMNDTWSNLRVTRKTKK